MDIRRKSDSRRLVVIGPCASGKTSLTSKLQRMGFDARACGQEHSEIHELWRHLDPDILIGLRIDLDTLRRRRSSTWSANVYARQQERLESGYAHADLVIDCHAMDQNAVLDEVLDWLDDHRQQDR